MSAIIEHLEKIHREIPEISVDVLKRNAIKTSRQLVYSPWPNVQIVIGDGRRVEEVVEEIEAWNP